MKRQIFSRSLIRERSWSWVLDAAVFGVALAVAYAVLVVARYWLGAPAPEAVISRAPSTLPLYAFYSIVRLFAAYVLSLVFAVAYGYAAAYSERYQGVMLAALDILQSIPVLSFLPGVMLAMVALFPSRQLGLELGSIVLIFTGQVWNMAFSFYASLKSIPRELREAARIYGYTRWQRFVELDLPSGVIGLVWNSMVSVAGGWFFLMACEMFVLGKRDFRLPGLGSYLQSAASAGDTGAILWGLAAMIGVIVFIDQLVWRPAIAWADRFKLEQTESAAAPESFVLNLIRKSPLVARARAGFIRPASERIQRHFTSQPVTSPSGRKRALWGIAAIVFAAAAAVWAVYATFVTLRALTGSEALMTIEGAGVTMARVVAALVIGAAWTIPAGVAIGFHPRLSRAVQPLAQIAASVPATALFPVILLGLVSLGGGLGIGSILLMLLGTQWYILFNVIAGAIAIPSDLREVAGVFHFQRWERWKTVILPGIFPYLITGLVTASGGAWNASIIAEYFHFQGRVMSTFGLGAEISSATDSGNFPVLLAATIVMAALVVCVNRLLWRPLYRLAESRYKLEG
ncbi:MAG: ABC transporter permease subunit [Bryobacteraceae bacterium]